MRQSPRRKICLADATCLREQDETNRHGRARPQTGWPLTREPDRVAGVRSPVQSGAMRESPSLSAGPEIRLPATFWTAALRGARFTCPRCGAGRLFRSWLKIEPECPACGQDWSAQRADDFPAWIAIIASGHILAPVTIALVADYQIGPVTLALTLIPASAALVLGLLQPAKGVVIAMQWWHGLHGFVKERLPVSE